MEAKELKLGNYVQEHSVRVEVNKQFFARLIKYPNEINDYQPIPLTEEWLKKFGFEYYVEVDQWLHVKGIDRFSDCEINYYKKSLTSVYKWIDEKGYYIFDLKLKIKHVHQLQNLYFALTGDELTIVE